jgi:hypothetical protein
VLSKLRSRLTYANTVASIALFIALGGTSYGLATGSIDSRELKNNTVRGKDIRNNDVRSGDIRNRSLLATDFRAGELPQGPEGPRGVPGATGQPGPTGPPGPSVAGYAVSRPGVASSLRRTGRLGPPSRFNSSQDAREDDLGSELGPAGGCSARSRRLESAAGEVPSSSLTRSRSSSRRLRLSSC